ncbi:MAG: protein kinase [Deltaproteobacteria bacterium]|nr:protein kinase [Deltaproteobacteria bacterium]MDQ3297770.1 protein kinase [Myxococcota bacterium]
MGTAPQGPKGPTPAIKVGIGDIVLDRYRVVEQIAAGGHSVVFRGTDERLSRPVCIKVFSGLGGKSGVGRTSYEHFVQEAFALSRLTHPNTLRIYDFGHLGAKDQDGMPLQVCEYMNGGTLSNVVREQGKQPLAETVRVVSAMCAALSEAHALGIVHRDIKPQNILFATVGTTKLPKLADFGIAKWSDELVEREGRRAEDTAIVAGQKLAMYSPSWAAPEQLAGQPVSATTDIYSLAVVAIYMLSGKAVFADEDVYAGYKKRRQGDAVVRDALQPLGVPASVIALLTKALAFDPKKRLAMVEELATELAAALEPVTEEIQKISSQFIAVEATYPVTPAASHPSVTPPSGTPETATTKPTDAQPADAKPADGGSAHSIPTPPAMPAFAKSWVPPEVRQPWMATLPRTTGAPRRLPLAETPQQVADRQVHFVLVTNDVTDLTGGQASKIRVTFINGPGGGRVIHVKGLTCFVAHLGGRPSPAVQLDQPSDVALVTPRAQEIGHVRVANGSADNQGHLVFPIGSELVAVGLDDCTDPILFDFGPGSDAYFVYTRGRTIPKTRRR